MPSLGELAILTRLYEEHRPRLLAMLERRIDPALAVRLDPEDLLGEVYIEARRRWPKYRDRTDLPGYVWLYGIARDRLIHAWRTHNAKGRKLDREMPWPERSSVQLGLGLVQGQAGPSTAADQHDLAHRMQDALRQLRDADREILWMRHYDELAFADIATVLGVSENTATVRYVRALRRLKTYWQETHGSAP
jgi:RNA polymerase sigma-70 factor (ECF subfamily)